MEENNNWEDQGTISGFKKITETFQPHDSVIGNKQEKELVM